MLLLFLSLAYLIVFLAHFILLSFDDALLGFKLLMQIVFIETLFIVNCSLDKPDGLLVVICIDVVECLLVIRWYQSVLYSQVRTHVDHLEASLVLDSVDLNLLPDVVMTFAFAAVFLVSVYLQGVNALSDLSHHRRFDTMADELLGVGVVGASQTGRFDHLLSILNVSLFAPKHIVTVADVDDSCCEVRARLFFIMLGGFFKDTHSVRIHYRCLRLSAYLLRRNQ